MLEQDIQELTAAVKALIAAIGGMQAPGPIVTKEVKEDMTAHDIKVAEDPNVEPEPTKSEDTLGTSQTSAPESRPVSYDDVKRATNAVSKISREKAIAGLARFGVSSATKLTEQQWPGYVDYMTKVAAGEIDPEASHE
jgi:hypothetical protein